MRKKTEVKEWGDFTNKFLGNFGKFFLLPLVALGGILCIVKQPMIGLALIFGAAILFLLAALLLVILKPMLVKKYPEPEFHVQPVSIRVELPGEEPREETVMTTGKYRVSSSAPRKNLTRIQKLAVDKCNGDLEASLHYLFTYMSQEDQEAYTKNITPQEASAYMSLLNVKAKLEMTEKELKKVVDDAVLLAHLDMTEEQILAAQKNPFVPKLWCWIGGLLVACIVVGFVVGLGKSLFQDESLANAVSTVLGCSTTFFVYKVVEMLTNSIRFRKAKRNLQKGSSNN